jgi:hypothetical protein
MRKRLVKVYERWTAGFPAAPPLPLEDITAMTYFLADGFLVDQLIEPELSEGLYTTMLTVFFRGLEAMAVGWEPSESDLPPAAKCAVGKAISTHRAALRFAVRRTRTPSSAASTALRRSTSPRMPATASLNRKASASFTIALASVEGSTGG